MAWSCSFCTFAHTAAEELFLTCSMCEHPRYGSEGVSSSSIGSSSLDIGPSSSTASFSSHTSELVGSPRSTRKESRRAPLKEAAHISADAGLSSSALASTVATADSDNLGQNFDDQDAEDSVCESTRHPLPTVGEPTLSQSDEVQDLDIGQALLSHADSTAALDAAAERTVSTATEEHGWAKIDNSNWVRMGSDNKTAAGNEQWGRAKPSLLAQMVKLTALSPRDSFVDVGSGCGQVRSSLICY